MKGRLSLTPFFFFFIFIFFMAVVVSPTQATLETAGERLRAGRLVAFPTETVYGLGAHALDPQAVLRIFQAKHRPRTDPIIVHVTRLESALSLVSLSLREENVYRHFAKAFWPGPLTLVAPAACHVPVEVTAETGYVGIRCPQHSVATALINVAGVPVAAPSANRFGHVSPTDPQHVMADLGCEDVLILDGGATHVGIESTVARVGGREVVVLRQGAVSSGQLSACLRDAGLGDISVHVKEGHARQNEVKRGQQAPGQLITHYAPNVPTFLLSVSSSQKERVLVAPLISCVLVDFGRRHEDLRGDVVAYRDLSPTGSMDEAARMLYRLLRWAEGIEGAQAVLLADVRDSLDARSPAVFDRTYRASSGRRVVMGAMGDRRGVFRDPDEDG